MLYEVITQVGLVGENSHFFRDKIIPGIAGLYFYNIVITSYSIHYTKLYESPPNPWVQVRPWTAMELAPLSCAILANSGAVTESRFHPA